MLTTKFAKFVVTRMAACPPGFEYHAGQLCGICGARDEHMTGGCPHMEARLEKCREGLEDWKKWMLSRGREGFWSGM